METKKIIAGVAAGLIIGGATGIMLAPQHVVEVPVDKIVYQNQTIEVPVDRIVEVEKTIEVPYNVTVEVPVDNENLDVVLQHIYDNDGDINYIIDDLDDDEVYKIADRVILVNEFKKLAVDAIKSDLFDELDRVEFSEDVEFDDSDLERLRIDDDFDEIVVDDIDFEDEDATVVVTGSFEQDDVKYNYTVDVVFKDNEFDELSNIDVVED